MISKVQIWLTAIRPKTLIASTSPVLVGSIIAIDSGCFSIVTFLFTLITALGIQIGTNLANDYFDFVKGADTSARKGPVRVTQSGQVSLSAIRRATVIAFILTALSGCYLILQGGFILAPLVAISLLLGVIYTGGPFPLAYLGLGDIFVITFFGPVATGGTYFLQTHTLSYVPLVAGLAPGALSTAILIINNLRDIEEDRAVKKKTLIVRFGTVFGKWEYFFCILLALSVPCLLYSEHPFALLASLTVFPAIPLLKAVFKTEDPYAFNLIFQKTGQLLLIYSLLFCIGWSL